MRVIDLKQLVSDDKALVLVTAGTITKYLNKTNFYDYYLVESIKVDSGHMILGLKEDAEYELNKLFKEDNLIAVENKDTLVFIRNNSQKVTLRIDGYQISESIKYEGEELFMLLKDLLDLYNNTLKLRQYISKNADDTTDILSNQIALGERIKDALDQFLTIREQYLIARVDKL